MPLLTPLELKGLLPKSREYDGGALEVHLNRAETEVIKRIGPIDGNSVRAHYKPRYRLAEWQLPRPMRPPYSLSVVSMKLYTMGEDPEDWEDYYTEPSEAFRIYSKSGVFPVGAGQVLEVVYNAESMEDEAKLAISQLAALSLIEDGLLAIEDGEFVERRQHLNDRDALTMAEGRIYARLMPGISMIGGG